MKTALTALILTLVSSSAMAGIDPDYRCEKAGGGVAFKVPTQSAKARLWHTDAGQEGGLEFTVTRFVTFSRPGTFSFEANYQGVLFVQGEVENSILTYKARNADDNTWVQILTNLPCELTE